MQLSYNKLHTFGQCRLKYRLAYVERLPQPPLPSLAFHRRLHAALRQYHHFAKRDGIVREEELLQAYARSWNVEEQPDVQASKVYQEGESILRRYCERENQQQRIPATLEHRLLYTDEYKREAVRLAAERGSIAQTAHELGISDNSLQSWKKQLQQQPDHPFPGQGNPHDAELAQAQRELARLKEENEILKKAAGFFTSRPR